MRTPTLLSFLSDVETPVSLFHKISAQERPEEPTAFLFESTDGDTRLARFSFIGVFPVKTVSFKSGQAQVRDLASGETVTVDYTNPLSVLQIELAAYLKHAGLDPQAAIPESLRQFPFVGGWVGYMGYGATRYFDGIPQQPSDPLGVPEGYYGLYDTVVLYDHLFRRITFVSYRPEAEARALWAEIEGRLQVEAPLTPLYNLDTVANELTDEAIFDSVTGPFDAERFCQTVAEAQAFIQEGQIFQIVLSHRFSTPLTAQPFDVYRTLQAINPSPYAYYLKFPEFVYLGSSPETFVTCHNGQVVLRALAGTRHRGATPEEDQQLAVELVSNEKERAEHQMLVDLGRNDLGRMCRPGSIRVGEIGQVTRYTHVMHMATELSGTLREDKTAYDVFQSCFPRGTVSGAPKIRAMHLLSQLEPEQRGIYSGVVGYFDFLGNMDGAIAIRSALIQNGQAHVNAGAGVVYDSEPAAEYQETRNKAKSTLKAIQVAQQLATNPPAQSETNRDPRVPHPAH
jgi:anthranilate synthase component 1